MSSKKSYPILKSTAKEDNYEVIGFDETGKNIIFLKHGKEIFIDSSLHISYFSKIIPCPNREKFAQLKKEVIDKAKSNGYYKYLYRFSDGGNWYNYHANYCKDFLEKKLFRVEKSDGRTNKKSKKRRSTKRSQ